MTSFGLPTYWQKLSDPEIKTVFVTGTGGGFDFVHSMTIMPELRRLGKKVIIGSFSFGNPMMIQGGEVVYDKATSRDCQPHEMCVAKLVDASCTPDRNYGPEVGICGFLDSKFPEEAPHQCYAYYARNFTVPFLTDFYLDICEKHNVDAIVCLDGGSDSLMKGDEYGLGDPIEDATTIAAVTQVKRKRSQIRAAILISIGFGCDRFNGVSDAASLRGIAELNAAGGYLGCMSLEKNSPLINFYDECIQYLQERARFRSVIANSIVEASKGAFGSDVVPETLKRRVSPGELYLWPLMAMHFAFDVEAMFDRSLLCGPLVDAVTVGDAYHVLKQLRTECKPRPEEKLPQ